MDSRGAVDRRVVAIATALAMVVAIVLAAAGLERSPDSVEYLSAATRGTGSNGLPFVKWPPLYPLLLAPSPTAMAPLLNVLSAAAATAGVVLALSRITERRELHLLGGIAVALSWPLTFTYVFVWSEPVFTAVVVAFLIVLHDRKVPAAAALAAAASLIRYSGVACIVLLAAVLIADRDRRWWSAPAIAAVPLVGWLARNVILTGTPTGTMSDAPQTLADNLYRMALHLGSWILPGMAAGVVAWIAAAALARTRMARVAVGFLGAFAVVTIVGATIRHADAIGPRLVAPMFPAAVILAVEVASRIGWKVVGAALLGVVIVSQLVGPVVTGWPSLLDLVVRSPGRWR